MIANPTARTEIAQEWATVRTLTNWTRTYAVPGLGGDITETPPESFFNLPLVLAYSVLDHALTQFIDEGVIHCATRKGNPCFHLDDKMKAAKTAPNVTWIDFDCVNRGRKARNAIAHRAKLLPKGACLRYISAIEAEFRNWGLIP